MTIYVCRDGAWIDKRSGKPMEIPERDGLCAPMVMPDTPDYNSPVTGDLVSGRRQRRNDLIKHNCIEYEPGVSPVKPENFGRKKREANARSQS